MSDQFSEDVKNALSPSQIWTPQEGDFIIGKYYGDVKLAVKKGPGTTIKIEDEERGGTKLIWKTDIIKKEFEKQKIQIGERVGLKYHGKPGKAHLWSVFVDRKKTEEVPF